MSTLAKEIGRGTSSIFLAEALALPAGLLLARLLSVALGPAGYGRYGVAASIVLAAEWLIVAAYSRISVQLLSEAQSRESLEPSVVRHYFFSALAVMALFLLLADTLAKALHAPSLAADLRWLSLDLPLFALAQAQRTILTARHEYSGRASAIIIRWVCRVAGTWCLLVMGFGIHAGLWAWPLASVAELICLRRLRLRSILDNRKASLSIWREGWAPFLFSAGQRALERIDLLVLQALGTAAPAVGMYVAAQNLSILPGIFAASLTPVLTATMTRERVLGREQASRCSAAMSLKAAIYLLPLAAIFGFCGADVSQLAFGAKFRAAGSLTAWLIAAYIGLALASTAASIISSQGRHRLTAYLSVPAAVFALIVQPLIIPKFGMEGAAIMSAFIGLSSGLAGVAMLYGLWNERFPWAMVLRAAAATLAVLALGRLQPVASLLLPLRFTCLSLVSGITLIAAGDWELLKFNANFLRIGRILESRKAG